MSDINVNTRSILPPGGERLLTRKETAARLGLAPHTLANWASSGEPHGPKMVRIGLRACRYKLSDVLAYMAELETVENVAA